MTAADLVLLIGPAQCGGPMVERGLARLEEQLRQRDVSLLRRAHFTGAEPAPPRLATTIASNDDLLGDGPITARESGRFRPTAEQRVRECIQALGAHHARIVLFVRRQDRLMEFAYLQALHLGGHHDFETQFPDASDLQFDYADLVARLAAVDVVQDVVVLPIELADEAPAAFIDEVLGTVDLQGELDLHPLSSKLRPYRAYSQVGVGLARACNAFTDDERELRLIHRFLIANFEAECDADTQLLDPELRQLVLAGHSESNAALFRDHLPHLPADSYASDAATRRLGSVLTPIEFQRDRRLAFGRLRR